MNVSISVRTVSIALWAFIAGTGIHNACGETVNLSIGTLPAGKSITVTYDLLVNKAMPLAKSSVSQQGTVSGSNFTSVLTDDPGKTGSDDATETVIANVAPVAGFGSAVSFNGSDDYIQVVDNGGLNSTDYTIETWVRLHSLRPSTILFRTDAALTGRANALYVNADGNFVHLVNDGSSRTVTGTTVAKADTWYHVAGVVSGGVMRLYVNGVEEGTALSGLGPLWSGGDRYRAAFGASGVGDNALDGELDEIRIWKSGLTAAQLGAWMYRGIDASHGSYANLAARYKLDEGAGTSIMDAAGTFNGTLVSAVPVYLPSTVGDRSVNEDIPAVGRFVFTDPDGSSADGLNLAGNLTFQVTEATLGTVNNISGNSYTFTPNPNVNGDATIKYTVFDGTDYSAPHTATIHIVSVNDLPVLAANAGLTLDQAAGQTVIGNALLKITDDDSPLAATLVYTITAVPTKGALKKNTVSLGVGDSFTQSDLDGNIVTFTPDGTHSGADSFGFTYSDGIAPGTAGTFSLNILDSVPPTAAISFSPAGPYTKGTTVTITADFSEELADAPPVQIAIGAITGGSALAATDMTRVTSSRYTYAYTVGDGNGSATVTLATGKDLAGNAITAVPTSGNSFTVVKTPTTVSVGSSGTAGYGETVTFTGTTTGGATGAMTFKVGGNTVAGCNSVPLSGSQAVCTTKLGAGSHQVTVEYGGDNTFQNSTSAPFSQTVNLAVLNVTADGKTKGYGSADPSFTYSHSGLTNGDTVSVFSGGLSREAGENAGTYNITIGTFSAGTNYAVNFTGATLTIVTGGVSGIVVDPNDPAHLMAGLFGAGIMHSANSGATWTGASGQPADRGIKALVSHPANPNTLFAASYGGGVFTSIDSGATWNACANTGLANQNLHTLSIDPTGMLYAGSERGILNSPDCNSWSPITGDLVVDATKLPVAIVIDPTQPNTVYAGLDGGGVYKTTDGGTSWTAAAQPGSLQVKALVRSAAGALFAATYGDGVFKSTDSGDTWSACATSGLASLNVLSLTMDSGGKLYAGTEDGAFVSSDGCAAWTAINGGLP